VAKALQVVLFSGKIPHEITPVHPAELVVEEIVNVAEERRLFIGTEAAKGTVHVLLVALIAIVPHARENVRTNFVYVPVGVLLGQLLLVFIGGAGAEILFAGFTGGNISVFS